MSVTVRDLFGHKEKPGTIGMELEVEALMQIPPIKSNVWLVKEDGSLRNIGYEYYTRNPVPNDASLMVRLEELTSFLKNTTYKVQYDSTRTSFHVHINVSDHTMIQMWNQVFAYWLLEGPLMNICGASRCGNQFCLRCKDAEGQVFLVNDILDNPTKLSKFNNDNLRYSSQNLKAVHTFGSLEYRGMRGTHDPVLLHAWSSGLQDMSVRAKGFKDPRSLFEFFDDRGHEAFVRALLPYPLASRVLAQTNYRDMMSESFDMLFDTVYEMDWDDIAKQYELSKPLHKAKDVGPNIAWTTVGGSGGGSMTINTGLNSAPIGGGGGELVAVDMAAFARLARTQAANRSRANAALPLELTPLDDDF